MQIKEMNATSRLKWLKKAEYSKCWPKVEKLQPSALLVGMLNERQTTGENSLPVPHKVKPRVSIWPSLHSLAIYSKGFEYSNKDLHSDVCGSTKSQQPKDRTSQLSIN